MLEEEEDELCISIQNARHASANKQQTLWHFKMFPELRPIDFETEVPFPGVPPAFLRSGGPRDARTWWVAPAGAGKTLVGQWLAAQYGWTFIQAKTWDDVKLPPRGRVFVELSSITGICIHVLQEIPTTVTVCIACPNLPLKKQTDQQRNGLDLDWTLPNFMPTLPPETDLPPEFNVLQTMPVTVWGDNLLQWMAKRVDPGGGFDVDQAHDLLFHRNMHVVFATPGEIIGFLGIVEKAGLARDRAIQPASTLYMRWIGFWLKALSERFVHEHPDSETPEFCGKRGAEILRDIEMERLRCGLEPLLSEAQWCDLIPSGHSPGSNRERFAELVALGVLVEGEPGRLSVKPVWLANALRAIAIECLYNDAPNGFGTLLLYENTSENALRRLIQEVCANNFRCIDACLKAGEPSTPEQVVALDGVFRAIGIALLNGISVPLESLRKIWDWQMRHTVQRYTNWPPIPILQIAEPNHDGATSINCWMFAAISISRTLTDAGVDIGRSALNPWSDFPEDGSEYDKIIEVLERIGWLGRGDGKNAGLELLHLSVYRLGAALLKKFGVLRRHGRLFDLQAPDLLVALVSEAKIELTASECHALLHLSFGLAALEDACRRRNVELNDVLKWCWTKWGPQQDIWSWPAIEWLGRHGSVAKLDDAARLWKIASADILSDKFYEQLKKIPQIWVWLDDPIWSRWLDVWAKQNGRWSKGAEVFDVVPEALALQAIRDGRVDGHCHRVLGVLWKRMPAALLDLVDELAVLVPKSSDRDEPIVWLVCAAPPEHCPRLVERAGSWLAAPAMYPGVEGWVRQWLMRLIEQRSPGWREAYELLVGDANGLVGGR